MSKCPNCGCEEFIISHIRGGVFSICKTCGYVEELVQRHSLNAKYTCPNSPHYGIVMNTIPYGGKCSVCGWEANDENIAKLSEEQVKVEESKNIPHCPTCGSTNVRKIPNAKKAGSIISFGILSNSLGKTYECLNPKCKYKW